MLRGLIATAAFLAGACEAVPVESPPTWVPLEVADTVITPSWAERAPSTGDILRLYPVEALSQAVGGVALLNCTVTASRTLDCVEGTETTPGYGFGPAAVKVSRLFVVKEGHPGAKSGARVRLPVRFEVE